MELANGLNESFFKTVYGENAIDIGTDLLEVSLDQITENEVLKELPIVGTVVRLGRIAISVRDRHLLKSAIIFSQEVKKNTKSEKLEKHRMQLLNNPKKLQEESEYLILYLDRQLEYQKSILYANLYKSYIEIEELDWDDFKELAGIIDALFISDIETLVDLNRRKRYVDGDSFDYFALKRLDAVGIVDYFNGTIVSNGKSNERIKAMINSAGQAFCEYVLMQH